jgi:type IV pilus assembly protein PilE
MHKARNKGFTLIELMVAVLIIGILTAIALPNYTQYVMRGKVAQAFTTLSSAQYQMENYFQQNRNYGSGTTCGIQIFTPASQYFTFSCALTNNGMNYTITATGQGQLANFVYTIDDSGSKVTPAGTPWNSSGSDKPCWVSSSNGGC